jgi:hypothetical protein
MGTPIATIGHCCCESTPPTSGWLRKQAQWPWPGFIAHDFDAETDILTTKYLRQVERIEITSVDFNGGETTVPPAIYYYTCEGESPAALAPFAVYRETESWFEPVKCMRDSYSQYSIREGWMADLRERGREGLLEGEGEEDIVYRSRLDECCARDVFDVQTVMEPEDSVWPYGELVCDSPASVTWATHLYISAMVGWMSYIGTLVSSVISGGGLILTETYTNGTRVVTLSEPYTAEDSLGEAQGLLDDFLASGVPLSIDGAGAGDDFTWGTGGSDVPYMTVMPWPRCDEEGAPVGTYRGVPYLVSSGDVCRIYGSEFSFVGEAALLGTGDWCHTWTEATPIAGIAAFDFETPGNADYTAPDAVVWADTATDYGYGTLADSPCP